MTDPRPLDLDAIEARAAAAVASPWATYVAWADVHARVDVPALAAEVRRLRAYAEDLRPETATMPAGMRVRQFHEVFGLPVESHPCLLTDKPAALRLDLLTEEFGEYRSAVAEDDLIGIADALADMLYVIHGTALMYGVDLDAVVAEVHRSNMSKLGGDGRPICRGDGKVLKGPDYSPPDVAGLLGITTGEGS